jgi:glycosyltransferase involved in cell wall biosynthesis
VIIALDATPLTVSTGGVARYTVELARALADGYPQDQIWLLSDQPFPPPANSPANLRTGDRPRTPLSRKWWLWGLQQEMMRRRVDVFHGTDFSVPYLPLRPGVMTIHDLSPWLFPQWQPDAGRIRSRTPLLLRAGLATMVITDSESIRRAVLDYFKLRPNRVVTVPLAASSLFRPAGRPRGNYLFFAATLEPRKNIAALIDAWRELRRTRDVELWIAGRTRADFEPPQPEPGLRLLGEIADEELPALYSGAAAVVYPTFYEGFGLPVLEAMQCGALVVTSRDPAVMEVAGEAALCVDSNESFRTLAAVLDRPEQFEPLRSQAMERAKQFSWSRTAEQTRLVYAEAQNVFRRK